MEHARIVVWTSASLLLESNRAMIVCSIDVGRELALSESIHIRRGHRFRHFVTDCSEEDIEVVGMLHLVV